MKHVRALNASEILELIFIYLTEVSSLRDYDEIIEVLANMGRALTSADRCTVWIVNDNKTKIWTKVAHGMDAIELPINSGIVGDCILKGKKSIINDAYNDERFNPDIDKQTGYVTNSMMVIPMFDNYDNIIGAFQVINHLGEKGLFDEKDMQRLMLASTYAAETLVSARLSEDIESTQREVIFTMGAIGESRSKETGNHVKRVAEYSKVLALEYGLSEQEAELLRQVSPMHDIGKVAIPDSILNKPGRFNLEERIIMENHAELGYEMLRKSDRPLFKAAAIVAYQHHEKWDGTGYPNKIAGEDIHIYGRITALADVFDALGSDRVYKRAWDDERIFKLFKEERGKHFDPILVDIFFKNIDTFLNIREELKDQYDIRQDDFKTKNQIKILGAYGTKSKGFGTSAFYINSTNVIDAGNLLDSLEESSADIENVWLTHCHLDHINDIAFVIDNYFTIRKKSLNIHGLPETIKAIKEHFLNDLIWPDFSKIKIKKSEEMTVTYTEIEPGVSYKLNETESIEAFLTDHTVASCGYIVKKNQTSVLITADTHSLDSMIDIVDKRKDIKSVVVECSFPSSMDQLALESKHLTPKLLFQYLEGLQRNDFKLFINHVKPVFLKKMTDEISKYGKKWSPKILKDSEIIYF